MRKVGVTENFREDNLPSGIVSRNLPSANFAANCLILGNAS